LETFLGGRFAANLSVPAQNVRFLLPLALALSTKGERLGRWSPDLLRISIAVVFFTHGVEALWHHPTFIDYIVGAGRKLLAIRISESTAILLLNAIGTVDLTIAFLMVTTRNQTIALWMAFWGLVTAASRIVYADAQGLGDFLVRAGNWGVPLALFLLWHRGSATKHGTKHAVAI
jgi:hypothetical protein